jgi:hypothetical protein
MVKFDSLNAVSHNVKAYRNVSTALNEVLLYLILKHVMMRPLVTAGGPLTVLPWLEKL